MTDAAPKINMILARDNAGQLQLWACRGNGKGCRRNLYRSAAKPCDDCMGPLPGNMTLADVQKRITQGDA